MKYYLIDAENKILGRMAAKAALVLSGKRKIAFSPHVYTGDALVIINCDKIKISGKKNREKIYHRFSGYPGGITSLSFNDRVKRDSRAVVREAVAGMLPKNKLRKLMLKNLFTYKDEKHDHNKAQLISIALD